MKIRLIAFYSLFLGISVIISWIMILISQEIPEGPIEFSLHLISELLMALLCLISGVLLIRNHRISVYICIAGHAMAIYSLLNAAGYYLQRDERALPGLFLILLVLSLLTLYYLLRKAPILDKKETHR